MNITPFTSTFLLLFLTSLLLSACGGDTTKTNSEKITIPAIGSAISDITGIGDITKTKEEDDYPELDWKELSPDGTSEDKILEKYQPQIDKIPEGDPGAKAIYDKMIAEFNSLPANPKLNGKKVRIPGYVTVLEQNKGLVSEFLLVPYYGACIHVPPPPLNNTLLIKTKKGQELKIDDTYLPVWVKGTIQTKTTSTDLADAGYLIDNAEIKLYDPQ